MTEIKYDGLPASENAAGQRSPSRSLDRWQKWIAILAFGALLAWLAYATLGSNLFGKRHFPESIVDYRILYDQSREVVNRGLYPAGPIFPYPPSAVSLFYVTGLPTFSLAASLWLTVTFLASLGVFVLGTSLVGLDRHWTRWIVALVALALINYCVVWDLRSQNCNMIYCFLLTASLAALLYKRDTWAGFFLAAGIALKLYPILLLPYFLWIGRRRAFAATIIFLIVFFGLLPLAVFRSHFMQAYATWIEMLRHIPDAISISGHPILVSIPFTLRHLGLTPSLVSWVTRTTFLVWLGAAGLALYIGWRKRDRRIIRGWDLAVDGGVLALVPVMISPYFEAYHAVPALLLALALAQRCIPPGRIRPVELVLLVIAVGTGLAALHIFGKFHARGLGLYLQILLLTLAIIVIRSQRWISQKAELDDTVASRDYQSAP